MVPTAGWYTFHVVGYRWLISAIIVGDSPLLLTSFNGQRPLLMLNSWLIHGYLFLTMMVHGGHSCV